MKSCTFTNEFGERITVSIGDVVEFKADIEQCGRVTAIRPGMLAADYWLTVENPDGFPGDYLRYATTTEVLSSDVWIRPDAADEIGVVGGTNEGGPPRG